MGNSAHDDIQLTIDPKDLPQYKKFLSSDLWNVLCLIHDIAMAKEAGNATFENREIALKNKNSDLVIRLCGNVWENKGWMNILNGMDSPASFFDLFAWLDFLDAVKNHEFSLDFLESCYKGMPFLNLLEDMDALSIGRPSTFSRVLQELEDLECVKINGDHIKISGKGMAAVLFFESLFPAVANPFFSKKIANLQSDIENDCFSMAKALEDALSCFFDENVITRITDNMWEDPESLYDKEEINTSHGGLIAPYPKL